MESLKEVYDKKSPLFIVTIATFLIALLARQQPLAGNCPLSFWLALFEGLVLLVGGAEIVVKTLLMEIFNKCCSSAIHRIHNAVVVTFVLANLCLLGAGTLLYLGMRGSAGCMGSQPHIYFVQVYVCLYLLVNVVVAIGLVSVRFQSQTMTVLDQSEGPKQEDSL